MRQNNLNLQIFNARLRHAVLAEKMAQVLKLDKSVSAAP